MPPLGFAFEMIRKNPGARRTVMISTRFNRWTIAAVTLAALAAPGSLSAQTPEHTGDSSAQFPSKTDLKALTTSGSYLAARHASVERDANSAAAFYRSALRTDPRPGCDAVVGLGQLWRRRCQGRGRQHRQADGTRMVPALQGPPCRHDPRACGQGKGRRHALRARLQARRFHAAGFRRICAL